MAERPAFIQCADVARETRARKTTEKRDVPRPLGPFRAGDQSASAEGAFHTEGLKPVDAISIARITVLNALARP
jgi:hypothetical protein